MAKQPANKLRLKSVTIDGFKSLRGVTIPFDDRATVLIGPNGSGKSTVLQALEFAWYCGCDSSHAFFDDRNWIAGEILGPSLRVKFVFQFEFLLGGTLSWRFETKLPFSAHEVISVDGAAGGAPLSLTMSSPDGTIVTNGGAHPSEVFRGFRRVGSSLSFFDETSLVDQKLGESISLLRRWVEKMRFYGQLVPALMRGLGHDVHRVVEMDDEATFIDSRRGMSIGEGGEHLASFINGLHGRNRRRLISRLKSMVPQISDLNTMAIGEDQVELIFKEDFSGHSKIKSEHVSDGMLRLTALAALAELPDEISLVALDEIENGLDPHIVPKLVNTLLNDCDQQFIFTSHSVSLINELDANQVVLLARDPEGRTLASRLADIPKMRESLSIQGPGEIWLHSRPETLTRWVREENAHRLGTVS